MNVNGMFDAKLSWNNNENLWILPMQAHLDYIKIWYYTVENYNNLPCPRPVKIGCIVNINVYYAHQTREIYQVLPYSVDFKAPGELTKTVLSEWSVSCNKVHLKI